MHRNPTLVCLLLKLVLETRHLDFYYLDCHFVEHQSTPFIFVWQSKTFSFSPQPIKYRRIPTGFTSNAIFIYAKIWKGFGKNAKNSLFWINCFGFNWDFQSTVLERSNAVLKTISETTWVTNPGYCIFQEPLKFLI